MSKITIDGTYPVKVKEVKLGSSPKGKPRIELFLETTEEPEPLTIGTDLYLSDAAIDRTMDQLEEVFQFNGDFDALESQLRGKPCSVVCEEERLDDGRRMMRVRWLNSPSAPKRAIKNEEDLRKSLSSRFARRGKGGAPAASIPPTPKDDPEDDCPF